MKDTQTMNECKTISAIIGENNFMGYDLQDVEEELYYKKERWIESLKYSQN